MDVLVALAEAVGVKVYFAKKRGEVILTFPLPDDKKFSLRLSKKKAFSLLLWIKLKKEEVSND
jgi:hypothetical protein